MDKNEIFMTLKNTMVELFELEPEQITLETKFQDLDIDSIDFIDLAAQIHQITNNRVNPDDFKKVRTMQELVDTAYQLSIKS